MEPTARFLSRATFDRALQYAASRPNDIGGTGLLFPFKSSVFQEFSSRPLSLRSTRRWFLCMSRLELECSLSAKAMSKESVDAYIKKAPHASATC